eukprot:scaffold90377_cov60-Phaeocystis_antarctica.AAC.2
MNASCEPSVRPTPLLLRAKLSSNAPGLANAPRVLFVATRDIAAGRRHHPLAPAAPRAAPRFLTPLGTPVLNPRASRPPRPPHAPHAPHAPHSRHGWPLSAWTGEELTWRYNAGTPPKSEKAVKSVYGGRRSQGAIRHLPPCSSHHRRA